jgi:hypothetical protein
VDQVMGLGTDQLGGVAWYGSLGKISIRHGICQMYWIFQKFGFGLYRRVKSNETQQRSWCALPSDP